jgi:UDPglucose--hexose-1-phosphate uridylyltransferase
LIYRKAGQKDWFLQVVPNKYPAFFYGQCPEIEKVGPYQRLDGVGFHEIFVTHDHSRHITQMSVGEVELILRAYQERYNAIKNDGCVQYILIFHNYGEEAGASVSHPHSQMIGLPVVPPDVANSLRGSKEYWKKHHTCVHCEMIEWEIKKKERIVAINKDFVAFCPFASRRAFEVRVFPREHHAHFDHISDRCRMAFAQVLREALRKLYVGLNDVPYNFFIHTAPTAAHKEHAAEHYHWHLEILPITSEWGGVEFGTGIEISTITPESAAKYLREIV